jgi:excisionase family DNA binding protein
LALPTDPKFVRVVDATHRYSLSRSTIERAIAAGEITRHKRGRLTLLEVAELDAWITGRSRDTAPQPVA